MLLSVKISPESGADLINLLNSVQGVDGVRRLIPIYDAVVVAFKEHESAAANANKKKA